MSLSPQTKNPVILHLSDLHWVDQRINKANNKGVVEYLYEDLKKLKDERCKNEWPNVIVISGDLTTEYDFNAYPKVRSSILEIKELFELDTEHVCIIPGNHDVCLKKRREAFKSKSRLPAYIYEEEYHKNFGDFLGTSTKAGPGGRPHFWGFYPELRLCIFGFDSNILIPEDIEKFKKDVDLFKECLLSGRIGGEQLQRFENFYNTMRDDEAYFSAFTKVAVLHHHTIPVPSEELRAFNILTDAGTFLEKLTEKDIDIILHGHEHFPFSATIKYNTIFQDQPKLNEILILGVGSSGSRELTYEKDIANHYSIIKIHNSLRTSERGPLKVDVEWRYNKGRTEWKFDNFCGIKSLKIKEKQKMRYEDEQRLEEVRSYKLKKYIYNLVIDYEGHCEITLEVNPVSTVRRLTQIEHALIAVETPDQGEFRPAEPIKIEHKDGATVKKDPKVETENRKTYIYVIPEEPLSLGQDTTYKFTQKSTFRLFFMSLKDVSQKTVERPTEYFEYFYHQVVRTTDYLEMNIKLPDKFLKSVKKRPFCKATTGSVRDSISDFAETERLDFDLDIENSTIKLAVKNPIYSMSYAVCWYLPEERHPTQNA